MSIYLKGFAALAGLSLLAVATNEAAAEDVVHTPQIQLHTPDLTVHPSTPEIKGGVNPTVKISPTATGRLSNPTFDKLSPKYSAELQNAYNKLPETIKLRLGDPKGGAAVSLKELAGLGSGRLKDELNTVMCGW